VIGAVILAAGAGTRMGGVAKALLPSPRGDDGGRTFLGAIVQVAARAGVAPDAIVIVVAAPHGDAVAREAARLGLAGHAVWNDDPARGMASSVAIGFEALASRSGAHVHAALLWPVDHPAILPSTIEALDDALGAAIGAAVPTFGPDGRGGHPALVAHALWPAMARCDQHADGARGVLRAARVIRVAVDDPGVRRDVDVPADLEALS
jgi:molybdenum cofactor cytidylyltransferase